MPATSRRFRSDDPVASFLALAADPTAYQEKLDALRTAEEAARKERLEADEALTRLGVRRAQLDRDQQSLADAQAAAAERDAGLDAKAESLARLDEELARRRDALDAQQADLEQREAALASERSTAIAAVADLINGAS